MESPQIDLPNEMILEIIEASISNGIAGVIYSLACSCKQWDDYIYTHIDDILAKNATFVETPKHKSARGFRCTLPCDTTISHHELPTGTLHGKRTVYHEYRSGDETLTENYYLDKLHGYRILRQNRSRGEIIIKSQRWEYDVKHGLRIFDHGDVNSYRVEWREISMFDNGVKSPISFKINCVEIDEAKEIENDDDEANDAVTSVTATTLNGERTIEVNVSDIPGMCDLDSWTVFYAELVRKLE